MGHVNTPIGEKYRSCAKNSTVDVGNGAIYICGRALENEFGVAQATATRPMSTESANVVLKVKANSDYDSGVPPSKGFGFLRLWIV